MPYLKAAGVELSGNYISVIFHYFFEQNRWLVLLKQIGTFFVSRPWLSLLIFAPWLILQLRFWIWLLPMGAVLAILGGQPATLVNYYSASLLGGFWLAVALTRGKKTWLMFSVLAFGSGAPFLQVPSVEVRVLRAQIPGVLKCIPNETARGIVSPALIGVLRSPFGQTGFEQTIVTEKYISADHPAWPSVNYLLLTPKLNRWEMNEAQSRALIQKAAEYPSWKEVSDGCQRREIDPERLSNQNFILLTRS